MPKRAHKCSVCDTPECGEKLADALVALTSIPRPHSGHQPEEVAAFALELSRLVNDKRLRDFARLHGVELPVMPAALDYLQIYAKVQADLLDMGSVIHSNELTAYLAVREQILRVKSVQPESTESRSVVRRQFVYAAVAAAIFLVCARLLF